MVLFSEVRISLPGLLESKTERREINTNLWSPDVAELDPVCCWLALTFEVKIEGQKSCVL